MKKTAGSPLVLCILTTVLYAFTGQFAYGNTGYLVKSKSVVNNLIFYSRSVATQGGGKQAGDAAPQLSKAELSELLIHTLQAGRAGQIPEVRRLLRMGADPDYKAHKKAVSPLDMVVQSGRLTIAKVFRQHGVRFDKRGSRGITYLHQAAASGNLPMVQFLVGLGISPNTQTTKGWTPLHHAARFGHPRVVLFLIRAGADSKLRNSDGFTPKGLAMNARYGHVARLFY